MNDEPLTDRAIVCSLKGRLYQPAQLSALLAAAPRSSYENASLSVNGYRVIPREGLTIKAQVRTHYANRCDQIATTLEGILAACTALGYDVSATEYLRIVTDNDTLVPLPTTLPVLLLPYWDNSLNSRYAIPSADGSACVFRLSGKYDDTSIEQMHLVGVDRAVRTAKTAEWLRIAGGSWHHGWYEDPAKPTNRFYSDVISDDPQSTLGIVRREFDTLAGTELDCKAAGVCTPFPVTLKWSKDLYAVDQSITTTSITVLNAKREGLFMYVSSWAKRSVSVYRLEMVIANVSMALLLFRWLAALLAMHRIRQPIGVGALACARSFHLLPIMLLPRLKSILAVFATVGCKFEGEQMTLSDAGFVMYPTIVEFTLLWFSLVNLVSKMLRRRISDASFGPVLLGLVLMHRLRREIADSGHFEMTSRVATLVTSTEYEAVKVADFFTTDLALRLNGNIKSLFVMKLLLLSVSFLVPLVFFSDRTGHRNAHARRGVALSAAEKALALRVTYSGGLGRSPVYVVPTKASPQSSTLVQKIDAISPVDPASTTTATKPPRRPFSQRQLTASHGNNSVRGTIVAYEIARAGYVVLGRDALVSTHDWFWFVVSAPLRLCGLPARHLRMVTFTLTNAGDGVWEVSERPHMYRVTDARFEGVGALQISAKSLR